MFDSCLTNELIGSGKVLRRPVVSTLGQDRFVLLAGAIFLATLELYGI